MSLSSRNTWERIWWTWGTWRRRRTCVCTWKSTVIPGGSNLPCEAAEMSQPPSAKVKHMKSKHLFFTRDLTGQSQSRCGHVTCYLLSQQLPDDLLHRHVHQLIQQNSHMLMNLVPVLHCTCRTSSWTFTRSTSQRWTTRPWNPQEPDLTEQFFSLVLLKSQNMVSPLTTGVQTDGGKTCRGDTPESDSDLWPVFEVHLKVSSLLSDLGALFTGLNNSH